MGRLIMVGAAVLVAVGLAAGGFALGAAVGKTRIMVPLACAENMSNMRAVMPHADAMARALTPPYDIYEMQRVLGALNAFRAVEENNAIYSNQRCNEYPVEGGAR